MAEPLISNVSDTARWVAVYRADESARPDAHFDDPLADRVAGARGRAIAAAMPRVVRNGWTFVARTTSIDDLIASSLADGCDRVLNLAAGFDCRPYRLDLPEALEWIEADLPAMIDEKEELLADQTPHCRLSRHRVDLADPDVRREFLVEATRGARKALVITEGLLIYLDDEQARSIAHDLKRDEIRWWITDLASPGVLKFKCRVDLLAAAARDVRILATPDREQLTLDIGESRNRVVVAALAEGARMNVGGVEARGRFDVGLKRRPPGQMATDADAHRTERTGTRFMAREQVEGGARIAVVRGECLGELVRISAVGTGLVVFENDAGFAFQLVEDLRHGHYVAVPGEVGGHSADRARDLEDLRIEHDARVFPGCRRRKNVGPHRTGGGVDIDVGFGSQDHGRTVHQARPKSAVARRLR